MAGPIPGNGITVTSNADVTSLALGSTASTLYLAYTGSSSVLVARSTNSGGSWSSGVYVGSLGTGGAVSLRATGTTLHLAYFTSNLMYTKSTDGGATWPAGNKMTVDDAIDFTDTLSLAFGGNVIYIAYSGGTTGEQDLTIARSLDGGLTR